MIICEDELESVDICKAVDESNIKVVTRTQVRGAEADVVFVHDFEYCEYLLIQDNKFDEELYNSWYVLCCLQQSCNVSKLCSQICFISSAKI
mgnify:CR=1 FL=1